VAIGACLAWTWGLDKGPEKGEVDIGGGIKLPTYMSGPSSHPWWAMVVLILVAASLYLAYVFSYLYLWIVSPEVWAPTGSAALPGAMWPAGIAMLVLAGGGAMFAAGRMLPEPGRRSFAVSALLLGGAACLIGAVALNIVGHWQTGLRPGENAYGAMVYMATVLDAQLVAAVVILLCVAVARQMTGKLDRIRRVSFENAGLLSAYAVGQMLFGLLLIHGFPRVAG
jgi:cytochrome c oxidase subunit I+III